MYFCVTNYCSTGQFNITIIYYVTVSMNLTLHEDQLSAYISRSLIHFLSLTARSSVLSVYLTGEAMFPNSFARVLAGFHFSWTFQLNNSVNFLDIDQKPCSAHCQVYLFMGSPYHGSCIFFLRITQEEDRQRTGRRGTVDTKL